MSGPDSRTKRLERRLEDLERTLGILIAWMAQSANSPIRQDEAEQLLQMLARKDLA